MSSPRVVQSASWQSASWRIRELSSNPNNNLIKKYKNSQHGFRKGYSCSTNLLVFLQTVTSAIDSSHNVEAIYLDLAKAFDHDKKTALNRLDVGFLR